MSVNDLLGKFRATNEICKDVIDIWVRNRAINIDRIFISSIAHRSYVDSASIQWVQRLLFDENPQNGCKFIENERVLKIDLWTDRTLDSLDRKRYNHIFLNNFINDLSYFL